MRGLLAAIRSRRGHSPAPRPAAVAMRPIAYAPVATLQEKQADGSLVLRARAPLAPYDTSLGRMFRAAVEAQPDRIFVAERVGNDWRKLTYAEARRQVDAVAAALIDRGLSAERPVMVLSGNAIDHALLMLAGYTAGIPSAPVSVAYSLQSQDHAKLKHIFSLLRPGLIYVADTAPYARALAALDLTGVEVVASANGAERADVTPFEQLVSTNAGPAVDAAVASTGDSTIAKILFTSGSTGLPKGVTNTHGMLSANQQQIAQIWPFLAEQPLVLVDWLPWNHTFGGNHNFNMVMRHAGTLFIDGGKPLPTMIGETVRNLREISPSVYFSVPTGYAALLPHLEQDDILAHNFCDRLRLIFYAGAALPQDLWTRLERVSVRATGKRIPMTSSWGTTETAPLATAAYFHIDRAGPIGVPAPGVELRLVPTANAFEIRVRGPNVTPGYWKSPDLTAAAFDPEGFYKPGDAVRFVDPADPDKGIEFHGRITEDFKLMTGTWVQVGKVRLNALAATSPAVQDAIVAGENRAFVGMLAWLNAAGCGSLIGAAEPVSHAELARHPQVREHIRKGIAQLNAQHSESSARIARVLLLPDLPSIDANEITDKGYINQRLALEHRRASVDRLFAERPDQEVIVLA
jgi:feruloyl-CoA synthase